MIRDQRPPRRWWNLPGIVWDLSHSSTGRIQLGIQASLSLIVLASMGLVDRLFLTPIQITPDEHRHGWNEVAARAEAPRIAALMPKFAITDGDGQSVSGAGKFAELWKFGKLANGGRHIPTWKQESGDCVSMGWANAIAYRQAFQIANERRNEVLKLPFPPYMYGVSRVLIGKRQLGRGPGSVGAWAAQGSLSFGVLPSEHAESLGFRYSGRLADQWGWNGPPKPTVDFGSKFRIRTVSQVQSWEDVRDALVHGYPVTVASNVGFDGRFTDQDGRRWGTAAGRWGHQMCFIGAEDRLGRTKGAYVLNSWGSDAHPRPLNDEPPGGFWVKWQDVQSMVQQGDSWAYSDFDGFPAESIADWNMFRERAAERDEQAEMAAIEQPDPQPVLLEVRQMFAPSLLIVTLLVGVILFLVCLRWKYDRRVTGTLSILLALSLLVSGASAEAGPRARRFRYQTASASCPNGICSPTANCGSAQCQAGQNCANGICNPVKHEPEMHPSVSAGSGNAQLASTFLEAITARVESVSPAKPRVIEIASNEDVPLAVWNAFTPPVSSVTQPAPIQSWNAMDPGQRVLRTYRDCYSTEKEFLLVIGSRELAERHLILTALPVAYEQTVKGLNGGLYRVFDLPGKGLRIESLQKARYLAQSASRKQ